MLLRILPIYLRFCKTVYGPFFVGAYNISRMLLLPPYDIPEEALRAKVSIFFLQRGGLKNT